MEPAVARARYGLHVMPVTGMRGGGCAENIDFDVDSCQPLICKGKDFSIYFQYLLQFLLFTVSLVHVQTKTFVFQVAFVKTGKT